MKNRRSILLIIFLMAVGFAAVATNLFINGSSKINPNKEDFNVYFSDAYINGVQDDSLITSDTTIEFNTIFESLGQEYILDYEVTNASKNYDAELSMTCTGGNEYLSVVNTFDDNTILESQEKRDGTLVLKQIKSYAGDDLEVSIECVIDANAQERTILGVNSGTVSNGYVLEGYYLDEKGKAIANANLVVFSETPHYVTTDENGYFICSGLERGSHEIYYVDDTLDNIKEMTKEYIKEIASAKAEFNVSTTNDITMNDSYYIGDTSILRSKKYCEEKIGTVWEFSDITKSQNFTIPCSGTYQIELWGAQGYNNGGYGAYTKGEIELDELELLNFNIGYQNNSNATNGATDVRVYDEGITSLKTRIMVAAGGSSYTTWNGSKRTGAAGLSGAGGGLVGYSGEARYNTEWDGKWNPGTGGTQTSVGISTGNTYNGSNGIFGIGGNGTAGFFNGGAGGWYGGGAGGYASNIVSTGGGGSSYISGHAGCIGITENASSKASSYTTLSDSISYTGYKFTNTKMIDGQGYFWTTEKQTNVGMPSQDGTKTITGNAGNGYAKVTLIKPYSKEVMQCEIGETITYDFIGEPQLLEIPCDATYKIELWGAQGSNSGGYGAYTSGEIDLKQNEKFLINIGGQSTPFNNGSTGGGSTDIRLVSEEYWKMKNSLKTRIMVAAGGSSYTTWNGAYRTGSQGLNGAGGGLVGYAGEARYNTKWDGKWNPGTGGSQTSAGISTGNTYNGSNGAFGIGGNGNGYNNGGAGGWYGGGAGGYASAIVSTGGGGSSYISGHAGCIAVTEDAQPKVTAYNKLSDSISYTGYEFTNTKMVDGQGYFWTTEKQTNIGMPSHDGTKTITGNTGNGYAKITIIKKTDKIKKLECTTGNYITYDFTGESETFIPQCDGTYKIELWGAQGNNNGGYGAYTSGEISLEKNEKLSVNVGGQSGLFNNGSTGGGATDIRLISDYYWKTTESLKTRIMVAAGGSSYTTWNGAYRTGSQGLNGAGGGLVGYAGEAEYNSGWSGKWNPGTGGTQTSAGISTGNTANGSNGAFGIGGNGNGYNNGGAGGWYGGGAGGSASSIVSTGGGGSSYISGHAGCIAVTEDAKPKVTSYSELSDSVSFTGYKFTNTKMIDGQGYNWTTIKSDKINMPTHDGTSIMTGNAGNGYAKITYIG